MKTIIVLMIEPGDYPRIAELIVTMESFKQAISVGADEICTPKTKKIDKGVYVLYNAEGLSMGLEPNRKIGKKIIAGVMYIIGANEDYSPKSLTNDELNKYMSMYWDIEYFDDIEVIEARLDELLENM